MEIRIKSGEELDTLLNALAKDIVDASIYYRLLTGLNSSIAEHPNEVNLSNTFWSLVIPATKEAYLFRLCRIFDQNNSSLNLVNFLDTIKSNLHFFGEPHFRERLKNNAFVDSLAEGVRTPTIEELRVDIEFASLNNPIVSKLMRFRGSVYAHVGAKVALGKTGALEAISIDEIELLLNKSLLIFNKYLQLYKATAWSSQVVGHDDYQFLFKFLQMGLEKYQADVQKEFDSWETPSLT